MIAVLAVKSGRPGNLESAQQLAMYMMGRSNDAEESFRKCFEDGVGWYAPAHNNLGAVLWDAGQVREAVQFLLPCTSPTSPTPLPALEFESCARAVLPGPLSAR